MKTNPKMWITQLKVWIQFTKTGVWTLKRSLPISSWCSMTCIDKRSDILSSCANLRVAYKRSEYNWFVYNKSNGSFRQNYALWWLTSSIYWQNKWLPTNNLESRNKLFKFKISAKLLPSN